MSEEPLPTPWDPIAPWLPVFFGIGIGVYFLLPREPSLWLTAPPTDSPR